VLPQKKKKTAYFGTYINFANLCEFQNWGFFASHASNGNIEKGLFLASATSMNKSGTGSLLNQ
jgi:hypothetical protein